MGADLILSDERVDDHGRPVPLQPATPTPAPALTDEAVEAAAIARWDFVCAGIPDDTTWDMRQPHARRFDTDCMRAALTAAAPYIAARALDGHRCDEQAERAYQRAAKAEAENRDLRAGIEALGALIEQWRQIAADEAADPMTRHDAARITVMEACADRLEQAMRGVS